MYKKVGLLLIVFLFGILGCNGNQHVENKEKTESAVVSVDTDAVNEPIYLKEVLQTVEKNDKEVVMFSRKEAVEEGGFPLYYYDNLKVQYGEGESGECYYDVSNEEKTVRISCAGSVTGSSFVHYVDMTNDGVEEILIVYSYDINDNYDDSERDGLVLIDAKTLETIDLISALGTMYNTKQAEEINKVVEAWKNDNPDYLNKWEGIKAATGAETTLKNETTDTFVISVGSYGKVEIESAEYYYANGKYKGSVCVTLAYVDGEFVVEKVIFEVKEIMY